MIDDYYVVKPHPNGGYTAVHAIVGEPVPEATTKDRKVSTVHEAFAYGSSLSAARTCVYSPEARQAARMSFASSLHRK